MLEELKRHREKSSADQLVFYGLLALLVIAPLPLASNRDWAWPILVIGSSVLGVFWIIQWLRGRVSVSTVFIKAWPMHSVLAVWLVWITIQILPLPIAWVELLSPVSAEIQKDGILSLDGSILTHATISLDLWATQSALLKSIAYINVFVLTLLLVNSRQRLTLLVWVLVYSGLFQAIYGSLMTLSGIEQIFFFKKEAYLGVSTGTFINRNSYAAYLVMCLSAGIGLMLSMLKGERSSSWKTWIRSWIGVLLSPKLRLRLYLIIMVVALVLTHSRMGNASFFAALMVAAVLSLLLSRRAKKSMVILIISLIIIDVVVVGAWFGLDKVADRLEKTIVESNSAEEVNKIQVGSNLAIDTRMRGLVNRDTLRYAKDFIYTGSGLGSFEQVYPVYRGEGVLLHFDKAHNDYLQFMAETGVPGLGMVGFVILYPLFLVVVAMRKRRDTLMRGMAFAAVMSITAILIHSYVDFSLQIPANAMTFMVILAIAILARHLPAGKSKSR